MPAEFLRDVVIEDRKKGRRLSMLPVSIAAHAIAGMAVLIVPLAADVEPPPVARLLPDYMSAMPVPPPPPPSPIVRTSPAPSSTAAPTAAPERIAEEVPTSPPAIGVPPVAGGLPDGGVVPGTGTSVVAPPPPPPPPPPDPPVRQIYHAGGDIKPPRKIVDVAPVYPEIARSAGVGGLVILEATINEEGIVEQVRVLRSTPLLEAAAIAAVKRWRYTPTLLNGKPVAVLMTVTVNFQLRD